MKFRELQQSDLEWMSKNSNDKEFYKAIIEKTEYDYALTDGDDVLGVGGVRVQNTATATGWFDISPKGLERPVLCFRTISEWTEMISDALGIVRLEAYVKEGHQAGIRTVEHLGFGFERKVTRYFGKEDAMLYVRFFDQEKQ